MAAINPYAKRARRGHAALLLCCWGYQRQYAELLVIRGKPLRRANGYTLLMTIGLAVRVFSIDNDGFAGRLL